MDQRDLCVFSLVIFILGITSLITETSQANRFPRTLEGRIVNGSRASLGQFPHQVSLRRSYNGQHFCGGSIIDSEWILTAAHCMFLNHSRILPWSVMIVAGSLWLNGTTSGGQQRLISRIIVHEKYDASTYENDLALMKLTISLNINNSSVAAKSLQSDAVPVGTVCYVSGWGYPEFGVQKVMNQLMYVDVPIINRFVCRQLYSSLGNSVKNGMICAGYIEGLKDACQGDSGGGMICKGQLSGVVSSGYGCAWPKYPGIYTDVSYYRKWILDTSGINKATDNGINRVAFFLSIIATTSSSFILQLPRASRGIR